MFEVVWTPIPNSSQVFALDTRADETLYCGSRGPGKTEIQLARFRRYVGLGYGKYWRGIIFDREYKNLDDIVAKSEKLFYKFEDGARFIKSASSYKWTWPSGEELLFRAIKVLEDYDKYHGHEYPYIGWNELCKYPTPDLYFLMFSCNRSGFSNLKDNPNLPPIPLNVFATTNSKGPGRLWVKERFIDPCDYGVIQRDNVEVFNPRTKLVELYERSRVAIFGSYKENIYLDKGYIAGMQTTITDKNTAKSWLDGDWNIASGEAFSDLWNPKLHVLPRFKIPKNWYIDRSFDWGSSCPFSVGFWAVANGESVTLDDGTELNIEKGSLIRFSEIYGTEKLGTNLGLRLSSIEVADLINEHEEYLLSEGIISKRPYPGPADNSIDVKIDESDETIKSKMESRGISWTKSNKKSGSRVMGYNLIRDRLKSVIKNDGPGLYTTVDCKSFIRLFPNLPKDPDMDDIDTTSEDHCYDETRYKVLDGVDTVNVNLETLF